jgi:hypothetical protein
MLLEKGANVNAKQKDGTTALHISTQFSNTTKVKLLLKLGANVDCKTESDITPLHISSRKGNGYSFGMLLDKGANLNAKQKDGTIALHIAAELGHLEIIRVILWDKGILLRRRDGVNINAKKNDGLSALHIATKFGQIRVVKMLLEYGAKVDSKTKNNITPLHIAAQCGSPEIVRFLLEFGADINSVDDAGKTALHIACNYTEDGEFMGKGAISGLVHHIVKLKAANLFVSDQNLVYYNQCFRLLQTTLLLSNAIRFPSWCVSWQEFRDFQNECELEIASMKCEIIHAKLTFYDILVRSQGSLAIYMRNENIVQVLKSVDIAAKFPMYASMIKHNFREAMVRKELLGHEGVILYFLFNEATGLPQECSEKILSYLSNEDFRMLIVAFQPQSNNYYMN